MRVLGACSLGGAGHWIPLAAVLGAATERGDDVLVVGPPALADMVRSDGFTFAPGGEPPEAAIAPLRDRLAVASAADAAVIGNRDLFARLAAGSMYEPLVEQAGRFEPDVVVRDPCEFASAALAARANVPMAQVAISLARIEWGSLAVAAPALDEHDTGLTAAIRKAPYITRFPELLDPSPFPTTIRFGGPTGGDDRPLPDWWPGASGPLVYATLGTVLPHMAAALDHYRLLIESLRDVDARVLLTIGRHLDPSALGTVPDHVHVEQWVDQRRVVAEAALTVCHGGSGTVYGSIAAGVPVVVLPSFSDQFSNAGIVEGHQLGRVVRPEARPGERRPLGPSDRDRITAAIAAALADTSAAQRCQAIARQFADAPSAPEALALAFAER
ncbi:MAG TPA: glycosyltransferase [Ilumatobacteraceae bacterium]|nr:glycosyltransferase [Ilumatobacteraceae bacterium]